MSKYTSETKVKVCSFARRMEGDTVTIADMYRQVFLSIPTEALEILDNLVAGRTVGEARDCFEAKHGETPDIEDFLDVLDSAGFVAARNGEFDGPDHRPDHPAAGDAVGPGSQLDWLSQAGACRLWRTPVVAACGVLVALMLVLVATDPAVIPGPSVLVFRHYLAAFSLGLFAFGLAGVAIHELAHLVAARAAGVHCRMGVSHRLWILVAETDMTGIWMAPKRARYGAFLAGPLIDAVSASVLVGVLWSGRHGWIGLSSLEVQVVGACLMIYLLRLLWQFFLFVRTDFYFVLATAFNCKNLLVDTQHYLHNRAARLLRSERIVDQSSIPAAEMRVVRWYSLIWLAGRAAALLSLFLVTLPVMWRYGVAIGPLLIGGRSHYSVLDALAFGVVTIGINGAGLVMWTRSLLRRIFERNSNAMANT
jgi:putative peptide zinc metalloprotease protein